MRAGAIVGGGAACFAIALGLAACGDHGGEGSDCPPGVTQKTPSGFCVPRYLSLKRGEVTGRKGPGKDYAPVVTYRARGLPVQVIDETSDWRRICDPDGGSAWVAATQVDGRRTVMATGAQGVGLRKSPADTSPVITTLRPRAIAVLGQIKGDWRQVSVDDASGWVKSSEVWGLDPRPQCR